MTLKDDNVVEEFAKKLSIDKNALIIQIVDNVELHNFATTDEVGCSLYSLIKMNMVSFQEFVESIFTVEQLSRVSYLELKTFLRNLRLYNEFSMLPCPNCGSELIKTGAYDIQCTNVDTCGYKDSTEPDYEILPGGRKFD